MADWLNAAANNNAHWCDAVCRAHGVPTSWQPGWWVATRRSPAFYPDAVTLRRSADFRRISELIDREPAASIKDSWAELELGSDGFQVLFEACWILRQATAGQPGKGTGQTGWTVLGTPAELAEWSAAHGLVDTFLPPLLKEPAIRFFGRRRAGRFVAGAVANVSGSVVGVSNVFGEQPWPGLTAAVGSAFPGLPMVGYERAEQLGEPHDVGFEVLGPLRVWQRPDVA